MHMPKLRVKLITQEILSNFAQKTDETCMFVTCECQVKVEMYYILEHSYNIYAVLFIYL